MHDYIWVVVNNSLRDGVILLAFKEALVCPVLKGPFHPVYKLLFWEKVENKVVTWQLQRILDEVDYLDSFHSEFRVGYGSEIALIKLLVYT